MPNAKKKVTTSKKPTSGTGGNVVTKKVTTFPPVQEKPPRGYEYKTFLVKKEVKKNAKKEA